MRVFCKCSFLVLYAVLFTGCKKSTPNLTIEFKDYLGKIGIGNLEAMDAYLVLPTDICPSCIETYKSYIKNIDNNNIRFILTGYNEKSVRLTFGKDLLQKENVWLDKEGMFYNTSFYGSSGQIFYFSGDGQLMEIREVLANTLNQELTNLTTYINANASTDKEERIKEIIEELTEEKDLAPFFEHFIGKTIPAFKTTTLSGDVFNSSDFIGKPMVLNFWFIQCPHCYTEIPELNKVFEDSKSEDFIFMSFCASTSEELENLFTKTPDNGYTREGSSKKDEIIYYGIIPDAKELAARFEVSSYPITLIVGKDGKITKAVAFTTLAEFPDVMMTYRLIKHEVQRLTNL